MADLLPAFQRAYVKGDGNLLSQTLDPSNTTQLSAFVKSSSATEIHTDVRYATVYNSGLSLSKAEGHAWLEIYVALWRAGGVVLTAAEVPSNGGCEWVKVYEAWKEVNNALIQGYSKGSFPAWTVPCLYTTAKWLRLFAMRADEQGKRIAGSAVHFSQGLNDDLVEDTGGHEKLEDAGRQISRIFSLCISDRAPLEDSRRWGLYYITNLLFKTYFKLNQVNLSKNILRSLQASSGDMPPLLAYPKSHVVTFKYYVGVISFLEEDYARAEEHLTSALALTHPHASPRNCQLILTYLIPTRLLTSHLLPTSALLAPYPELRTLFTPLARCIKRGDLAGFDAALEAGSAEFAKRRIYLTLERGRDIALRNLFRRVFLAGDVLVATPTAIAEMGEKADKLRRTRVPVQEFVAAVRLSLTGEKGAAKSVEADRDEVECLISNLVYKNLMKGYVSRERATVVLSKVGAFPGTGV